MLNDDFIQSKQVDKTVIFHEPLKRLKLKTFASDGVIKKDNFISFARLLCQVTYITSLNMRSGLRNLVNH